MFGKAIFPTLLAVFRRLKALNPSYPSSMLAYFRNNGRTGYISAQSYKKCPSSGDQLDSDVSGSESAAAIRHLKFWITVVSTVSCCVVLALATCLWRSHISNSTSSATRRHSVPDCKFDQGRFSRPIRLLKELLVPMNMVMFEQDRRYAGRSNQETDEAWGSLMPVSSPSLLFIYLPNNMEPGDGFIVVKEPRKYGLPPGKSIDDQQGELYDVSMFHQLHCLTRIRIYLWTMRFSIEKNNTAWALPVLLDPKEDHVGHCFDYIRQAIMCAGDMTLEWPRLEPDGRRFAVDGWHIQHQCRNWVRGRFIST